MPSESSLSFSLNIEPKQTETVQNGFYISPNRRTYYIQPVYEYELYGLVVSKYNTRRAIAASFDADFNVTDLCVVWGQNALDGIYKDIKFSNTDSTCEPYFRTREAYNAYLKGEKGAFKPTQFSNNHLLAPTSGLARKFRNIKVGDQVYIKGYLVNYGPSPQNIIRKTSTTRTDRGRGSEESIYVTEFDILHHTYWYYLFWFSLICLVIFSSLWYYTDTHKEQKEWHDLHRKNF
ncbi:hypothetical protein [Neisseria sp. Ec49-e6-T10]|uniref:hypothetical protein n=1 Tax=Neisseria sp. Ec49-e6-T10 TaxID=3140744 RepID=UPI003EBC24E2